MRVPVRFVSAKYFVMNIAAIRNESPFVAKKWPDYLDPNIQNRQAQGIDGDRPRHHRGRFVRPGDGNRADQEPNQQAAAIAEEDGSRIKVVAQESADCTG